MNMSLTFFETSLLLLSLCLALFLSIEWLSGELVVGVCLILYLLIIGINYVKTRRITLFQIWLLAFIFMIWSEMMIITSRPNVSHSSITAIVFLLSANAILLLGYEISPFKESHKLLKVSVFKSTKYLFWIIFFSLIAYFLNIRETIENTITSGRELSETLGGATLFGVLTSSIALMIPAFIAFYYKYYSKDGLWKSFLLILPIVVVQLLLGTRYRLLFMLLPFLVLLEFLDVRKMNIRKLLFLVFVGIGMILVTGFVKKFRNMALDDMMAMNLTEEKSKPSGLLVSLAEGMSPEGVVEMTEMANRYFANHDLTYGKEITFPLYFWIPRSIWKDKPTPIDHWLIRKYETVSDAASTASGFTGEIRADFGMFCFLILFVWGGGLFVLDRWILRVFSTSGANVVKILASLIYPWIFFFVRSPLTSTNTFLVEIAVFFCISKFFSNKKLSPP